jgi:hypothetical protein
MRKSIFSLFPIGPKHDTIICMNLSAGEAEADGKERIQ